MIWVILLYTWWHHDNRPVAQIPQCTIPIPHNAPFCNRNVHICAHFCYKMVHCGIFVWCIRGFVTWVQRDNIWSLFDGSPAVDPPLKWSVIQMVSLMLSWANCWTDSQVASDLRCHDAHVTSPMILTQQIEKKPQIVHIIFGMYWIWSMPETCNNINNLSEICKILQNIICP